MKKLTTLIAALFVALFACGRADQAPIRSPGLDRDARAFSWLSRREADHAAIDEALAKGEYDAAAKRIDAALSDPPPLDLPVEAVRVVRQDLYYRKSETRLAASEPAEALAAADAGLALGQEDDLFTANLFIARGRAHEAQENKNEAARDYHQALKINEVLLSEALDETPK